MAIRARTLRAPSGELPSGSLSSVHTPVEWQPAGPVAYFGPPDAAPLRCDWSTSRRGFCAQLWLLPAFLPHVRPRKSSAWAIRRSNTGSSPAALRQSKLPPAAIAPRRRPWQIPSCGTGPHRPRAPVTRPLEPSRFTMIYVESSGGVVLYRAQFPGI